MDATKIHRLFTRLRAIRPRPTTELRYLSPFELLIAVILSAQSTDKKVNEATARLFRVANTPRAILDLGEGGFERPHQDHRSLQHQGRQHHQNLCPAAGATRRRVPRDRAALEALPGVGRKTANVILNTAFGEPTIAVDTHIFRVANRTGLAPGRTVREVEEGLLAATPEEFRQMPTTG
jgi:endonuclease-3